MIIYLIPLSRDARRASAHRDATIPEDRRAGCPPSVLSCTAWGFSCLANCFASGELLPRLFTLTCALLPKNRRCLFCDTFRHRSFSTAAPAYFTRHVAVWCSDFPPANLAIHQRSSAIGNQASIKSKIWKPGTQGAIGRHERGIKIRFPGFLVSRFYFFSSFPDSERRRDADQED